MDVIRFSLYTALAVITYLLLLAWQSDHPGSVAKGGGNEPATIVPPSTAEPVTTTGSATDNDPPRAQPETDTDLPLTPPPTRSPEPVPDLTPAASPPSESPDTNSQLVNVTTDTLNARISLTGGDLVHLSLRRHLAELSDPDQPFVILESGTDRNYIAQSGLIGSNGIDSHGRAVYRADSRDHRLADGADRLVIDLHHETDSGVRISKRYTFQRGSYLINISYLVDNPSATTWEAVPFGQIRRSGFNDPTSSLGFLGTFLGFVSTAADDPYMEMDLGDIDDGSRSFQHVGGWIGFSQQYFLSAWIPAAEATNYFTMRRSSNGEYLGEFTSSAMRVAPGTDARHDLSFYAGPKDKYALQDIAPNLDLTVDYSWLWFIAEPLHWLLVQINGFAGNWGITIILLTVLVKAAMYKLSATQYRSMAGMRRLMPRMQQMKESYGDDRAKLQKAMMELYRKEKINPFGGCLPMIVQMPVFIALYWVLLGSVELRHAPFFLWIEDLSVRDPFFILPLLMGAAMYLQTSLSPTPADPMQANIMKFMPVMMTAMFLWFPAGLVLYWLVNALLGIAQQWYIMRTVDAAWEAKKSA